MFEYLKDHNIVLLVMRSYNISFIYTFPIKKDQQHIHYSIPWIRNNTEGLTSAIVKCNHLFDLANTTSSKLSTARFVKSLCGISVG